MKKFAAVLLVLAFAFVIAGCNGLDAQRVREERVALDEWKKVLPLIDSHPALSDAEKKSWHLFAQNQEFRVKQEEEAIK